MGDDRHRAGVAAGVLAFRRKFIGATALFYLSIARPRVPSIIISLGIGVMFQQSASSPPGFSFRLRCPSHLDAALRRAHHVSVFNRFSPLL